ncbi:molybdopterin-guanine dinucleotide biosynthesis protein A [Amycolatopsis jiangsuensis]|uniref:Molybdopterin-guanine dinucleotide biosynthesis protein A n=2 Tax=Amycolatopsis jiangsuensis TaxID=1181879 RepID=A0A840IP37_9PSEU|nr:NTP transferase domain-containing protein [Amycolatopsis jiangsuensis]MBB4683653.1 molybdopterin-guanine dinucleotide biosynthesis protein A [Amycolatopsis jiangsuensis]
MTELIAGRGRAAGATFAGIVLAGGAARRMSGVDKPELVVRGTSLLGRALAALAGGRPLVVVGPRRAGYAGVVWAREPVPGTGPVAALATGLESVRDSRVTVLLAGDLPGVGTSTVDRLRGALGADVDGAVLVDAAGERQWLTGAWRTAALRAALPVQPENRSLRRTLGTLRIAEVPAEPGEADDIDTPEDWARYR